jgi:hypothetical protein
MQLFLLETQQGKKFVHTEYKISVCSLSLFLEPELFSI